jgi:hypothetical protein
MAAEWQEGKAESITVFGGTGPLAHFVRQADDAGRPVWRKANPPMNSGGPAHVLKGVDPLTTEELLEALRGPLGAD